MTSSVRFRRNYYLIAFPEASEQQLADLEPLMTTLGYAKKIKPDFYRLEAILGREEVIAQIAHVTGINQNQIKLTSSDDFIALRF